MDRGKIEKKGHVQNGLCYLWMPSGYHVLLCFVVFLGGGTRFLMILCRKMARRTDPSVNVTSEEEEEADRE